MHVNVNVSVWDFGHIWTTAVIDFVQICPIEKVICHIDKITSVKYRE